MLQTAHYIHHIIMWLLWMFFVHHVYSAIVMSQVEGNGDHRVDLLGLEVRRARDDLIYSGYRFKSPKGGDGA